MDRTNLNFDTIVSCAKKASSPVVAGLMGAGLSIVLFPSGSPLAGAVVGAAKYIFENKKPQNDSKTTININSPLEETPRSNVVNRKKIFIKNITNIFLMSTIMIVAQVTCKILFKTNLFSPVFFNGSLLLFLFPYFLFSILITKQSVDTFKERIIDAFYAKQIDFSYTLEEQIKKIFDISFRIIYGMVGFSFLSLNPYLGAAFGVLTLLQNIMSSSTNEILFPKDPESASLINKLNSSCRSLIAIALSCNIALTVAPICFGTTGLVASVGAYFLAKNILDSIPQGSAILDACLSLISYCVDDQDETALR